MRRLFCKSQVALQKSSFILLALKIENSLTLTDSWFNRNTSTLCFCEIAMPQVVRPVEHFPAWAYYHDHVQSGYSLWNISQNVFLFSFFSSNAFYAFPPTQYISGSHFRDLIHEVLKIAHNWNSHSTALRPMLWSGDGFFNLFFKPRYPMLRVNADWYIVASQSMHVPVPWLTF